MWMLRKRRLQHRVRALAGLLKRRQVDKVSCSRGGRLWTVMTVIELDSSALESTVAFTGRLACMTRAEAFEVVRSTWRNAQPSGHAADQCPCRWRAGLAAIG